MNFKQNYGTWGGGAELLLMCFTGRFRLQYTGPRMSFYLKKKTKKNNNPSGPRSIANIMIIQLACNCGLTNK